MASKPRSPEHLIGKIFGRLTVVALIHMPNGAPGRWVYHAVCDCICGNKTDVLTASLVHGRTQSCGCYGREMASLKNRGSNSSGFSGFQGIGGKFWTDLKRDAQRRGWAVDISIEHAWGLFEAQRGVCALSGVALQFGRTARPGETTASVDRIDSSLPYQEGNIQWVNKTVNLMKHKLSDAEFLDLCARVVEPAFDVPHPPSSLAVASRLDSGVQVDSRKIGSTFGRLTVLRVTGHKQPYKLQMAHCLCECGKELSVRIDSLVSGKTKSCGCLQFTGHHEIRGAFWAGYRSGAAERDLPFEISIEQTWDLFLSQGRRCALTGLPLWFGSGASLRNTNASIDRIDNDKGYVAGNIQWVDKRVNIMRKALSIAEFVEWCKKIHAHQVRER